MNWKTDFRSIYYDGAPAPADLVLPWAETALLVIDIQNVYLARPDRAALAPGEQRRYDAWTPFHDRLAQIVIPNTRRLLGLFRRSGIECLFARIACHTKNGRDRSLSQKDLDTLPPGNLLIAPLQADLVKAAAGLDVDRVLGGQDLTFALESFSSSKIGYHPFPGRPEGHPTRLGGSAADIERDCERATAAGCPGVDLLAYRAIEADPVDLIKAARRGLGKEGYLIVAGSVSTPERIKALGDEGADAFTIGTAIFEERFAPGVKGVKGQCEAVLKVLGS